MVKLSTKVFSQEIAFVLDYITVLHVQGACEILLTKDFENICDVKTHIG